MKKGMLLVFALVVFLSFNIKVFGDSISDKNNPGQSYNNVGTTGSATSWLSVGGKAGTQLQVVRVRIFRNGSVLTGMDKYYTLASDLSSCYNGVSSVVHCKTIGYDYSTVKSTSGLSCLSNQNVSFGCIVGNNLGNSWGISGNNIISNGDYLENYLKSSNYNNLKSLLATMGYDENNFNDNDIVVIEPATVVNCGNTKYFGTSTALMKKDVSYRGGSCGSTDTYKGYTFQLAFRGMSQALSQNGKVEITTNGKYNDNNYSGFGYFKYNISSLKYETKIKSCNYYKDHIKNNYVGHTKNQLLMDLYNNNLMLDGKRVQISDANKINSYNGLLNFDNPTCAPVQCNYNYKDGCLNASYSGNTISSNNISCYNDTITYNNKKYFCETHFEFNKNSDYEQYSKLFSGRFYLYTNNNIPSFYSKLVKTCYIPTANSDSSVVDSYNAGFKYNDYISNIKLYYDNKTQYNFSDVNLNGEKIDLSELKFTLNNFESINNGLYSMSLKSYYKMPSIWLKKGSGEIVYNNCSNCVSGGSGILTKFTFSGEVILKFMYNFKTPLKNKLEQSTNSVCKFTAEKQVIKTNGNNDSLQIIFRTVTTNSEHDFLDSEGNIRTPGINWSSKEDQKKYLDEANNSYNKTKEGAKYKIKLTPEIIREIKKYNKENPYDNYKLTCKYNGSACVSEFLTTFSTKYNWEINTKNRSCYNDQNKC